MIDNLVKFVLDRGGSITPLKISAELTGGTGICNPSIFIDNDQILCNIRHVEYALYHCPDKQKYQSFWGPLAYLNPEDDARLKTINYLCVLNNDLSVKESYKVDTKYFDKTPIWEFVGLEDARVVKWEDKIYLTGVRRDTTPNGEGRMELSQVIFKDNKYQEISRLRIQPPTNEYSYCEKNWMPILDKPYHYIRWTNPTQIVKVDIITGKSEIVFQGKEAKIDTPYQLRGNTQIISWKKYDIGIIHEVDLWRNENQNKDAIYTHRIIIWDKQGNLVKTSDCFNFMTAKIEFACGLANINDNIIVTFGFQDNAAFALTIPNNVFEEIINE